MFAHTFEWSLEWFSIFLNVRRVQEQLTEIGDGVQILGIEQLHKPFYHHLDNEGDFLVDKKALIGFS